MRAILMIIAGIVGKQPHEVKIVIEKLDVPRISMYLVLNPRGETVPSEFVSQYIERISRDAVEKYQPLFKRYVRHRQGGKHYAKPDFKRWFLVCTDSNIYWNCLGRNHSRQSSTPVPSLAEGTRDMD